MLNNGKLAMENNGKLNNGKLACRKLSACAGYGNYIIHTLEHFHLNILQSVQLHN
jgi:hypothetical protein